MELTKSAVDCVLREERESFCDLTDACLYDELVVALISVGDEIVEDADGIGSVLLDEPERLRIAVLDAGLGRDGWCRHFGGETGSDVLRTFAL
ncbi:MAG: hypothetical protein M3450_20220 [Actinomycetota bacterium]|nr:hypothetical protein [Actinomycetota bacterium]